MKVLKSNYHTHTALCNHAKGYVEDYVVEAIRVGYLELGFSEHNPVPVSFLGYKEMIREGSVRNMSYDTFLNIYLPLINDAKEKYGSLIKIYSGLECEYLDEHKDYYKELRSHVEYMNLGIHFYKYEGNFYNTYKDVDYKSIYGYLDTAIKAMDSGLFKIFVHPDLFMYAYKNENGERVFDDHCRYVSRKLIECAIKNDVYLEINVNGVSNSVRHNMADNWLYPIKEFFEIVKEYNEAKVILGADAHTIEGLSVKYIQDVLDMANEIGLKVCDKVEF